MTDVNNLNQYLNTQIGKQIDIDGDIDTVSDRLTISNENIDQIEQMLHSVRGQDEATFLIKGDNGNSYEIKVDFSNFEKRADNGAGSGSGVRSSGNAPITLESVQDNTLVTTRREGDMLISFTGTGNTAYIQENGEKQHNEQAITARSDETMDAARELSERSSDEDMKSATHTFRATYESLIGEGYSPGIPEDAIDFILEQELQAAKDLLSQLRDGEKLEFTLEGQRYDLSSDDLNNPESVETLREFCMKVKYDKTSEFDGDIDWGANVVFRKQGDVFSEYIPDKEPTPEFQINSDYTVHTGHFYHDNYRAGGSEERVDSTYHNDSSPIGESLVQRGAQIESRLDSDHLSIGIRDKTNPANITAMQVNLDFLEGLDKMVNFGQTDRSSGLTNIFSGGNYRDYLEMVHQRGSGPVRGSVDDLDATLLFHRRSEEGTFTGEVYHEQQIEGGPYPLITVVYGIARGGIQTEGRSQAPEFQISDSDKQIYLQQALDSTVTSPQKISEESFSGSANILGQESAEEVTVRLQQSGFIDEQGFITQSFKDTINDPADLATKADIPRTTAALVFNVLQKAIGGQMTIHQDIQNLIDSGRYQDAATLLLISSTDPIDLIMAHGSGDKDISMATQTNYRGNSAEYGQQVMDITGRD